MRKIALVVLLVIAILIPLAASGSSESTGVKTTLRIAWWGNPTRDERTLKVFDMYQAKNPSIVIEPETVGWAGYWDRINTQVAAGNMPDVMQHDYAYLLQFVGRNLMANLDPMVQNGVINLKGVDETFLSGGRVGGKLFGVNLGTNAVTLVYDPAILQKAGVPEPKADWSWTDFETMAKTVFSKTGVQTLPLFATDPRVGFENLIRQTGATMFSADGKALGFTDTKTLEDYWNVQIRLLNAGVLIRPEIAFVNVTPQEDQFSKGNSWVQYIWSNQVVSTWDAANKPVKITLLPKLPGAKRPGTFLKPSMFFSIPAMSKNQVEAARFVNYFVTDIDANKVLLGERGVPIVPPVRDAVKSMLDPKAAMAFDYIGLVGNGNASPIAPPDPAATGEILKLFRDTTQNVLLGKIPSKDAAAAFMKQANAILAK